MPKKLDPPPPDIMPPPDTGEGPTGVAEWADGTGAWVDGAEAAGAAGVAVCVDVEPDAGRGDEAGDEDAVGRGDAAAE